MRKRPLLPAALLFCCCAAMADSGDRALAEELLRINGTRQAMEATVEASLRQLGSAPDDPARPAMERFVRKCFAFDALKGELTELYLENYTPDELRALIAFYRTPLGRKKARACSKVSTPRFTSSSARTLSMPTSAARRSTFSVSAGSLSNHL